MGLSVGGVPKQHMLRHVTLKNRLKDLKTMRKDGAFGYFAMLDGTQPVFAFKGTDFANAGDVIADVTSVKSKKFDLGGTSYDMGVGFHDYFSKLMPELEAALATHETSAPLLVVGHSLGGAIANIAAVYLANKRSASVMLRTFGSPRVFTWKDQTCAPTPRLEPMATALSVLRRSSHLRAPPRTDSAAAATLSRRSSPP